jgi:lysozyme family protein
MQRNYKQALKHVLYYEGGYTDHPDDPGGATNLGITIANLADWRKRPVTKAEVRALTLEEAEAIYKAQYWDAVFADQLDDGVDIMMFDCAVNQGVSRAVRILQDSIGVKSDGQFGPVTMAALKKHSSSEVIDEFAARRMCHYASLQKLFKVFGLGWSRRLMSTHELAVLARL